MTHNKLWPFGNHRTLFSLPATFIHEQLPKMRKDFRWCNTSYYALFTRTREPFPGAVSVQHRPTYTHFHSPGTPPFYFPLGFQRTGKERKGQDQSDSPKSHTPSSTFQPGQQAPLCSWAHLRGEVRQVECAANAEENSQSQTAEPPLRRPPAGAT